MYQVLGGIWCQEWGEVLLYSRCARKREIRAAGLPLGSLRGGPAHQEDMLRFMDWLMVAR